MKIIDFWKDTFKAAFVKNYTDELDSLGAQYLIGSIIGFIIISIISII